MFELIMIIVCVVSIGLGVVVLKVPKKTWRFHRKKRRKATITHKPNSPKDVDNIIEIGEKLKVFRDESCS